MICVRLTEYFDFISAGTEFESLKLTSFHMWNFLLQFIYAMLWHKHQGFETKQFKENIKTLINI